MHVRTFASLTIAFAFVATTSFAQDVTKQREIESVEELESLGLELKGVVVQGLDLTASCIDWANADLTTAVFLGCKFAPEDTATVIKRGGTILPVLTELPYEPFRSTLYSPAELMEGMTDVADASLDKKIYDHFMAYGKFDPPLLEAIMQRAHDHAMDDALREFIGMNSSGMPEKQVVAIMGGHSASRKDPYYRLLAHTTHKLARDGFLVSTGGGPGMMEAGNLGAYLAHYSSEDVDKALEMLSVDDAETPGKRLYLQQAREVRKAYPKEHESLAIPTWFYGHEPSNLFSSHVAKYFSNGIREDVLLSTAVHGMVFAPGSAGTTQEVFQEAAQNHYATFGYVSPMAFLGVKHYCGSEDATACSDQLAIYPLLRKLAKDRAYEKSLTISDEPAELVDFIKANPPFVP